MKAFHPYLIHAKRLVSVTGLLLVIGLSVFGFDLPGDYILSAYTGQYVLHENSFAAARIVTPASDSTSNETEVMFANGVKAWVRHTIPSHPARRRELEEGDIVLWNEYHSSYHTEENYRVGAWHLGLVTSTDQTSLGSVGINNFQVSIEWVRIPDRQIEFVIDLREGEALAAFHEGSSIYESGFGVAAPQKEPRSDHSGGRVTFSNGVQADAPYIISSHRAGRNEIDLGDKVLWNDNFSNQWTENNYRLGGWYFGVVTKVDEINNDIVEVNGVPVPLVWIRIEGEAPRQVSTIAVPEESVGMRTVLSMPDILGPQSESQQDTGSQFGSLPEAEDMEALARRINSSVLEIEEIIGNPTSSEALLDPLVTRQLDSIVTDSQEFLSMLSEVLQRTVRVESLEYESPHETTSVAVPRPIYEIHPEVEDLIEESILGLESIMNRTEGEQQGTSEEGYSEPCRVDIADCDPLPCSNCCWEKYPEIEVDEGESDSILGSAPLAPVDLRNEQNRVARTFCLLSCIERAMSCLASRVGQDIL